LLDVCGLCGIVLHVVCNVVMFQQAHSSLCSFIQSTLYIWPRWQWPAWNWFKSQ